MCHPRLPIITITGSGVFARGEWIGDLYTIFARKDLNAIVTIFHIVTARATELAPAAERGRPKKPLFLFGEKYRKV